MADGWRTTKEVADACRVAPMTVRRWITSGKLAAIRPGRAYLVAETAMTALMASVEPKTNDTGSN